jgi:drug/metabolite transporter (DMT)-like permease
MSFVFALLAAFSNAANTITQHVASTNDPEGSKGWQFVRYLLRNPLWLLGWVAQVAAFVFQAIALHDGLLSAVQALLMTELVFALVLRRLWLRQAITPLAWASAGLTCVAVSVFIAAAEPRGGSSAPASSAWASSIIVCAGFAGVLCVLGLRGSPARRAALFAIASATIWALEATFIKTMTDNLTEDGIGGTLLRWPIYAVVVGGIAGVFLTQVALHVGPLSWSQPFLVIVDPMLSIFLSVHLFGERFSQSAGALAIAGIAFAAMCVGIVQLTRVVPETAMRGEP